MVTYSAATAEAALKKVRELCFSLPEVEEKVSHGAATFHVRGKTLVMFLNNHHSDGRLAIWCKASHDAQDLLVPADPERFFVPPYVGKSGWVGIRLERAAPWGQIADVIHAGWRMSAPKRLLVEKTPAKKKASRKK